MRYVLKHLSLGIFLIAFMSSVLLVSDLKQRRPRSTSIPQIAVFQFATRLPLDEGVRGIVDGLSNYGYVTGKNIETKFFNAENDFPTTVAIAKEITNKKFDMVLTVSTPCLQAVANANKEGKVIHVFGLVTDPFGAGVGINRDDPVDHPPHLVGTGNFQPVEETFQLAKELFPGLNSVGVVWNPTEASSEACTRKARTVTKGLGIELLEANVGRSSDAQEATMSLIQRGIQALWIGGDNTVEMATDVMVSIARKARIPVFTNNPDYIKSGILFGLGANYYKIGLITGNLAAEVLNGTDPAKIPIQNKMPQKLALNKEALVGLRETWQFTDAILATADILRDESGIHEKKQTYPERLVGDGLTSADLEESRDKHSISGPESDKKWRIKLVHYVNATFAEAADKGIKEGLVAEGLEPDKDYELKVYNAQGDVAVLNSIFDTITTRETDLIMLTSTPTLQIALKRVKNRPVVFTTVASPVLAGAGRSNEDHQPNVTGISTMSDFQGMVDVLSECFPDVRRIGTIFSPAEINSVLYKDALKEVAGKKGIDFIAEGANTSSEVVDAALSLCSKRIDAMCQISDNLTGTAFAGIAEVTRKLRVPLFAFDSHQVREGGAVIAVARDYEQSGRDAAALAARIMRGENPDNIPFQLVSKTNTVVNLNAAKMLGLKIPTSLVERADEVIE